MTAVMGTALILIIRAGGLNLSERAPRYGLRLRLGVVALAAGVVIARRKPKPAPSDGSSPKQGRIARMTARPSPLTAVTVGVLLFYYPSVNFIAAVQVIATAHTDLT